MYIQLRQRTNDLPHLGHYIQSRHMNPVRANMPHLGTIPKLRYMYPFRANIPYLGHYTQLGHMHPVRAHIAIKLRQMTNDSQHARLSVIQDNLSERLAGRLSQLVARCTLHECVRMPGVLQRACERVCRVHTTAKPKGVDCPLYVLCMHCVYIDVVICGVLCKCNYNHQVLEIIVAYTLRLWISGCNVEDLKPTPGRYIAYLLL